MARQRTPTAATAASDKSPATSTTTEGSSRRWLWGRAEAAPPAKGPASRRSSVRTTKSAKAAQRKSPAKAPAKAPTKASAKAPATAGAPAASSWRWPWQREAPTAAQATKGTTRSAKDPAKKTAKPAAKKPVSPARKGTPKTSATKALTTRGARKPAPAPAPTAPADAPPRRPLLQRRSLGSVLARTLVLGVALVGMVAFAVALAKVTLVPSPSSDALVHTNLRPGASIRAYVEQPEVRDSVKQIGGNVLLGVPFGILLPALFPRSRGLLRVSLLTALVMVMVETAQGFFVEGRAFDIDDVILNTLGALLGYLLLGRRIGRALHPRRHHWWHTLGYGTPPPEDPAP
ncbi:VanZ family protein [Actinacidiphila guanduensis]|uniref:VanZ like family protein n=1 Tax=Actinacidiphila guanduensis TaxID=310781 RepID=A0A1H0FD50_9ACTN|nr:VanZ family protein [Actinacidiphila guanduensis]SDN92565.1 VanZ like family protein [Actinacidiphila guanduensis]